MSLLLVTEMLMSVLNTCSKEELAANPLDIDAKEEGVSEEVETDHVFDRNARIKKKIKAIGKMARVFAVLR